ncbi:MAG: serine/threonine-protein kinase [Candidatus Sulfotelmatobacter sp.]
MAATAGNNWQRIEALFYAALDQPMPERPAFLDQACGDDILLRKEVESLLEASEKTSGFLQKSVHEAARSLHPVEEITIGRQIGAYKLLRVVGEGGMGAVYLASRADDLYKQQVAIKLMHAGFAQTRRMLLRFSAERQILANLNHPNIARLLDGGIYEGVPYLVMEYIDGISIVEYCRKNKLGTEARLRLFGTVCEAVEYAHKNLVVHRDIKPGNILVTPAGVPKLLDFGIAKLLSPEDNDLTQTRTTERMMTPEYASPEQVRGDLITTSTDVYALGVLLYELLSGTRPFHLKTASPVEIIHMVCEQTPTAPSTAAKRAPDLAPPDAARKLCGELDNVVLMALRKEPARRYVSVGQLAEDIKAFLDGYPVRARTDAWGYRTSKFIGRHKTGVFAAVAFAIALVGFSLGMALFARRAQHERLAAERESQFLNSIFQSTNPDQTRGKQITGQELLDDGARRVDTEFSGEPQLQSTLYYNIGQAYVGLGLYQKAEALLQRAYALRTQTVADSNLDTAATLDALATAIRLEADFKRAEPLFRKALAIRRAKLGAADPLVARSVSNLGECLYWEGQDFEAESLLREALAIERPHRPDGTMESSDMYLALVLERKGSFREATDLLREAVTISGRIDGTESSNYANSLHDLAGTLIDAGDLSGAEKMDRQALAIRRKINTPGYPDLAYPLNNLGFIFLERGDWAGAEPFLKENLEIRGKPGTRDARLAAALNNWARLLQEKGDYRGADDYYKRAMDMIRAVGGEQSWGLAKIMANVGMLRADQGNYAEAEQLERQSMDMRQKLGGEESPDMASSQINLAIVLSMRHDLPEAETLLKKALSIRTKELSAGHPAEISTEVRLGEVLIDQRKFKEAEALLHQATEGLHAVQFPLMPWQFAEAEIALGEADARTGRTEEAERLLRNPAARMKGYPQAALQRQILQRAQFFSEKLHNNVAAGQGE